MNTKLLIEQKPFMSILAQMQPICTKRTTLDATSYILFQVGHRELVLKSTDLEISLQASYVFKEADITDPRSFLLNGRRIFEIVKELDGDIAFHIYDNHVELRAGKVHVSLNIKDAQEFPPFPERIENLMHLDAAFALKMLNNVAFLIPQNNAHPALNGLYLEITSECMTMTVTDGHCLAQTKTPQYTLEERRSWLLPRRAVFEVKKIVESAQETALFLGVCGNQLVFSGESFNFFTKLLADPFPAYTPIMAKEGYAPARIDRSQLVKTLRRSACLLSGQFIATNFGFGNEQLRVSMHNKEVGTLEEQVPLALYDGETLDVRFYAPYLLNGLQSLEDDQVQFYLKNSAKPIIFESEREKYHVTYLVMPVSPSAGRAA